MDLVKESTVKTYSLDVIRIEECKQYTYDSREERDKHSKEMQSEGYTDKGLVITSTDKENVYRPFAEYNRIMVVTKLKDRE